MAKLKVALIGPIEPYRGGIAQYNTQLHQALQDYADVKVISFKRQYPKWLYPGKDDKELDYRQTPDSNVSYLIDAYSPLSLKKAIDNVIANKTEVVFVTWWTLFWQPGFAYLARRLRKKGIKVIYICHNVFDHDSKKIVQNTSKLFLDQTDGFIVHATEEEQLLRSLYKDMPILNTKTLPVHDGFPIAKGTLEKRGRLELLFFGFIRPYKGLDVFVDALAMLNDKDVYATVVGETWSNVNALEQEIKQKNIPNIELHLKYVSGTDAAEYFARADVTVLPYKSATGSAVASLAYFYKRPILGTRVGGLRDVVLEGKTGWLVEPDSPRALAEAIRKLGRKSAKDTEKFIAAFCKENGWKMMAKRFVDFAKEA